MKLLHILKQYYLPWFLVFLFAFGIRDCSELFSANPNKPKSEILLVLLIFTLAMTFLIGTLLWYVDTRWGPRKLRKNLQREPWVSLKDYSFELIDDSYKGVYKDYWFSIGYAWIGGEKGSQVVYVSCLFNPLEHNYLIPKVVFKQLEEKYELERLQWGGNFVNFFLSYNFNPPEFAEVKSAMDRLVDILQVEDLQPISPEAASALNYEELELYSYNKRTIKTVRHIRKPALLRYGWLVFIPLFFCFLHSLAIYRVTLVSYKIWLIPSLTFAVIAAIVGWYFYAKYSKAKGDLVFSFFMFGFGIGHFAFMEINYRFTDNLRQYHQIAITAKGTSESKEKEPYLSFVFQDIEKEIQFPADQKEHILAADSILIGTEKGFFGKHVIKEFNFIEKHALEQE